jgi:hypothetical protein
MNMPINDAKTCRPSGQDGTVEVPFTQYMMPDGRTAPVWSAPIPSTLAPLANAVLAFGCRFEIEMLRDYCTVSMTIHDPDTGDDVFGPMLCTNGPEVPATIEKLIGSFSVGALAMHRAHAGREELVDEQD